MSRISARIIVGTNTDQQQSCTLKVGHLQDCALQGSRSISRASFSRVELFFFFFFFLFLFFFGRQRAPDPKAAVLGFSFGLGFRIQGWALHPKVFGAKIEGEGLEPKVAFAKKGRRKTLWYHNSDIWE